MAERNMADRNLLFGILALQMDFISRDELVAAMQAWVFDKTRALGDLLVERGNLPAARRQVLEALVEEHVQLHGGEVEESLAAVGRMTAIAGDLRAIGDVDLGMSIGAIEHGPESTGPYVPKVSDGDRYQVLRRHAKGGLGEVFVAFDQALNREVAIKEIQERHANDPASRSRFVQEAEITGALEHPGIVPVYDLGRHADGRPYYAMRFVRGQTMKEAIRSFYAADARCGKAGDQILAFRQLLRRFIDTCNAVGYAHSRGILHRDLKPSNIILGPYGETLVADWGLAKPIGRQGASIDSDEESLKPASSSGVAETIAGTAIGTPAYMSPEQASGRLDMLGPATDVYGLGATLYTLLTGKPPVEGDDVAEVLRRVQYGDIAPPRRVNAGTPRALEAVCLKAMALKPDERYADALSLASDIEHWLADEPVSAWKEPFVVRSRRWLRRHQSMVGSAAAATMVLLVCLAAGLGIVTKAYRQEKQAREYAVEQEGEAQRQHASAEARAAQIEERFQADRDASEQMLTLSPQALPDESEEELRTRLERHNYFLARKRQMDATTGFTYELAGKYLTVGNGLRMKGNHAQGAMWLEKARSVYEQLVFDHPEEPIFPYDLAELYLLLGQLHGELADAKKAWECFDKASGIGNEKVATEPLARLLAHDTIEHLNNAGNGLQRAKGARSALGFHEKALAVAEKRLRHRPADIQFILDVAACEFRIGVADQMLKLPKEALPRQERVKALLEGIANKQALSSEAKKTLARAYHYAGQALVASGKASEALHQYEQAVLLRENLANRQAGDTVFTVELADEYREIYCLHRDAARHRECQTWCERAVATFGRLAEDYPRVAEYAYARDEMLVRHTVAVARQGRHQEATRSARELLKSKPLPSGDLYNLACVFATSVMHARGDSTLTAGEKKQLGEDYAEQATQLLFKAKAAGYFAEPENMADLKNDPDLQAIRSSAAFQGLVASLEAAAGHGGRSGGSARR